MRASSWWRLRTRSAELMSLSRTNTCIRAVCIFKKSGSAPGARGCSPDLASPSNPAVSNCRRLFDQRQIRHGFPAARLYQLVADLLAVGEAIKARALKRRNMQKDIPAAIPGLDEAKALLWIESFHRHEPFSGER